MVIEHSRFTRKLCARCRVRCVNESQIFLNSPTYHTCLSNNAIELIKGNDVFFVYLVFKKALINFSIFNSTKFRISIILLLLGCSVQCCMIY